MHSKRRIVLVLIVALATTFAHALALNAAQSEGLLLKTLTATESRERTRENPSQREQENQALSYANMAVADMALPTRSIDLQDFYSAAPDQDRDFPYGCDGIATATQLIWQAAPRAPPKLLIEAPPKYGPESLQITETSTRSIASAPRAPPYGA